MIPIITDSAGLKGLVETLSNQDSIAVDLEADSMHNYREKVCLLQFSTTSETILVDPLAVGDLRPLLPVMAAPDIRKIFHGADYDVRSLYRDFNIEIHGIFDTMICCQLIGEEKVGLADLLDKYLQISLDKKFQKADWSKRPLPEEMLHYAAEDTRHLHRLAAILEKKLIDKGRAEWLDEECRLLEKVRHSERQGPLFLRIKGAHALNRRQLAVLEALLQWREKESARRNCPPFKVFGNRELVELARSMPLTVSKMKKTAGISPRLVDRYGTALVKAIEAGQTIPDNELPSFPEPTRYARNPDAESRLRTLKKFRMTKSAELQMDPGILINTSLLETISRQPPIDIKALDEFPAMKKWQRRELGDEIIRLLTH